MGTSGDRKGYKIFSINTTVRNPKRNTDFLTYFKPYDGQVFTEVLAHSYFFDLVANGVYRLTNISEDIKNKIENGIKLSDQEAIESIKNNPQASHDPVAVNERPRIFNVRFRQTRRKQNTYNFSRI